MSTLEMSGRETKIMKIEFNTLIRHYQKYKEEYCAAMYKVVESGSYVLATEVDNFEKNFKNFVGTKHCIGVNSGLDALTLAFRSLGVGPGDEVLAPAYTYIASIMAITSNGAIPILVEPDEYYTIDVDKLEGLITNKTKAILAVHLYGQPANMTKIKEIANKYNLYVVEDCAQSHGAFHKMHMTGAWGDVGCFSFYPTKNLGAFGDAGAVVTNNDKVGEQISTLRNYGSRVKYEFEEVGINSRLDEIQAAVINVKLSHYNEIRSGREKIATTYLYNINNPHLILPRIRENSQPVWHLFVIRAEGREEFRSYLEDKGIGTQIHYPIPPHLTKAYDGLGYEAGDFPITENYSNQVLSLPLYDGMTENEVEYVVEMINAY